MTGYKAVIRYDEFRWYILEMEIPDDATVVHSGNGFYRADKVIPKHFWPTKTKLAILDKSAHSWFEPAFSYTLGTEAVSKLDSNVNTDCAAGIHFFQSRDQAINWGNANFGQLAAI